MFYTEQQNRDGFCVLPPQKKKIEWTILETKTYSFTNYSTQSTAFLLKPKPIGNEIKQKFV